MRFVVAFTLATLVARGAAGQPEALGPYQVGIWENPPGPPVPIARGVYYPTNAPCPGGVVALVHGFGESGDYKLRMAELAASQGLVAVAPSIPGALSNPTDADAQLVNALLDWVVLRSSESATPIAGKVDPSKYGVAGHSNGGVVFRSASNDPKIQAIVGWDAVSSLSYASGFHGPSLHLIANGNQCGGGSTQGYDSAPPPKRQAVVSGSSHCDFNDPMSPFCVGVCGTPPWNPAAVQMIERYSIAWFTCLLGHDPSMVQYLDLGVPQMGLAQTASAGAIQCQPECPGSGGVGGVGGMGGAAGAGGASGAAGTGGSVGGDGGMGGSTPTGGAGGAGALGGGGGGAGETFTPKPGCDGLGDCSTCATCFERCVCGSANEVGCRAACGPGAGGASGAPVGHPGSGSGDEGGCGCRARGQSQDSLLLAALALSFCLRAGGRSRSARRRCRRDRG